MNAFFGCIELPISDCELLKLAKDLQNEDIDLKSLDKSLVNEITARKQEIADNAAKEYNREKRPYDRALEKGLEGVTKTPNDGVSFAGSPYIYETDSGKKEWSQSWRQEIGQPILTLRIRLWVSQILRMDMYGIM